MPVDGRGLVLCREIVGADLGAVVALLTKGFAPLRKAAFWAQAMARLSERSPPAGFPQFGYVLEHRGALVGVLLVIASEVPHLRCNVSSWYVEPGYRPYGTLLVRRALRQREASFINVTPAPETWRVLDAQGYVRYVAGRSVCLPALARGGAKATVALAGPALQPGPDLSAVEARVLIDHARWGCISVVCQTEQGRVPFVFGRRRRLGMVPFAYMIYCRDLASLSRHGKTLGLFLARLGIMVLIVDADWPIPGMPSWFQDGFPKYRRGTHAQWPGDLAYTERAIFGV